MRIWVAGSLVPPAGISPVGIGSSVLEQVEDCCNWLRVVPSRVEGSLIGVGFGGEMGVVSKCSILTT